jgi:[ribosomal protein S18]-alanine N-acetyltransferase
VSGTPQVRLRPMRWWDIEPVHAIDREAFGSTAWSAESFWAELARPQTRWYTVAERADDSRVTGYAGLMVNGSEADVQTLAVAPSAQGTGVGRVLLDALVEAATARGATSMILEVRADNDRAIGLYRGCGFEQIAVRRRYYQPEDVDALIMRRRPLAPGPRGHG